MVRAGSFAVAGMTAVLAVAGCDIAPLAVWDPGLPDAADPGPADVPAADLPTGETTDAPAADHSTDETPDTPAADDALCLKGTTPACTPVPAHDSTMSHWVSEPVATGLWGPHDTPYVSTRLALDDAGTLWLAFPACTSADCEQPDLYLARRPVEGTWTVEPVHVGLTWQFALAVPAGGPPSVVYQDWEALHVVEAVRRPGGGFDDVPTLVPVGSNGDRIEVVAAGDWMVMGATIFGKVPHRWLRRPLAGGPWVEIAPPSLPGGVLGLAADGTGALVAAIASGGPEDRYELHLERFDLANQEWETTPPAVVIRDIWTRFSGLALAPRAKDASGWPLACVPGSVASWATLACRAPNGTWTIDVMLGEQVFGDPSLMFDATATPTIVFDQWSMEEMRVLRPTRAGWTTEVVAPGSVFGISTLLLPDGRIGAAFHAADSQGRYELRFATSP